jgi:uncharacterized membrane protein
MSTGGRASTRERFVRRAALIAGALVIVALLFFLTGHWIIGLIVAAAAAVALWVFFQVRTVR